MIKDNHILGKVQLEDIPPMPRGYPRIEVTFDIDRNGILNVSAVEKNTGKIQKIQKINDIGRMSADEIERLVQETERYKAEEEANKQKTEAKNALENYIFQIKNSINDDEKLTGKVSGKEQKKVLDVVQSTIQWFDSNNENAENFSC
jgi:molecular chaperone DnaK (HSP70)